MFFNQIRRNSRRNRQENGLYFGSLVAAIVFSYILLSLGDQDVMVFLKTMESDAVQKLLLLVPLVYMVSMFFVFFMVYFSNKYQIQRRSHEFGIYQMMGMKRRTLFLLMMGETVWNSGIALLIGLPVSVFVTELISLITARLVGLGIIGHQFGVSATGLIGTILGFMAVQLTAMLLLSFYTSRKEPLALLRENQEHIQRIPSSRRSGAALISGVVLLLAAYGMGLFLLHSLSEAIVLLILFAGIGGTFLLFKGLGSFIGRIVHGRSKSATGLFAFTGRQLQENVFHQSKSLAISSLLIFLAMACVAYGIGTAIGSDASVKRTVDFSIKGEGTKIEEVLESGTVNPFVHSFYPMLVGHMNNAAYNEKSGNMEIKSSTVFSWEGLRETVTETLGPTDSDRLLQWIDSDSYPYFISLKSYNALLKSTGMKEIALNPGEVAIYSGYFTNISNPLQKAVDKKPGLIIDGEAYTIAGTVQSNNLVADRTISIGIALIVPDEMYMKWVQDKEPLCWNVVLKQEYIEKQGLMQALNHVDSLLSETGLEYESYLKGLGRNLFYIVGGSYLTLYMGILFLVIANTVMGLKFLIQQRNTRHRYRTLLVLGAGEQALCHSARTQIRVYFNLIIGVGAVSSVFGICSMFASFLRLPEGADMGKIASVSGVAAIVFLLVELAYIRLVERESAKEIRRINTVSAE